MGVIDKQFINEYITQNEVWTKDDKGNDIDQWNRKKFIELFKMYTENLPDKKIQKLPGLSETVRPPVMIGDKEKCLLLENQLNEGLKAIEDMALKLTLKDSGGL